MNLNKNLKKFVAGGLSAALILTAPGLSPYEALAGVLGKQGAPVRVNVSGSASGAAQSGFKPLGNFSAGSSVHPVFFPVRPDAAPSAPDQSPAAAARLGFAAGMELPKDSAPMSEFYGSAQVQMDALEGIRLKKQGGAVLARQGDSKPADPGKLPGEIQPPEPWPAPGSKNPGDSGSGMVPGEPSGPAGPGGGIPSVPGEGGGPVPLGGGKGILAFLGRVSLGAGLAVLVNSVAVPGLVAANVGSGLFVLGTGLPILGLSLVARNILSRYDSPRLRSVRWTIDLALGASLASSALALPGILSVSSQIGFFNLLNEVRGNLSSVLFENILARENMIGISLTSLAGLLALPSMMTASFNLERLIHSARENVSYRKSRLEWPSAHWVAIGTVFALTSGLPHAALYVQAASILWSLPLLVPVLERAHKGMGEPQTRIKKIARGVLSGMLGFSRLSVRIFDIGYLAGLAGVVGSLGIYAAGLSATPLLAVHPLAFVVLMYSPERMAKLTNLLFVRFLKAKGSAERTLSEEESEALLENPLNPPPGFPRHHYQLKTAAGLVLALSLAGTMGVFVAGMKAVLSSALSLAAMSLLSYGLSGVIAVKAFGGKPIAREEDPGLYKDVEDVLGPLGRPTPKLYEVNMPGNVANAFASGPMPRFAVMAFTKRIREITQDKKHLLKAIIAHEAMHIHHWDMAVLASLNWMIAVVNSVSYNAVWRASMAAYQLREAGKIAQSQYGIRARAREALGVTAGLFLPVMLQLVMAVWAPTLGIMLQSFVGRSREAFADQDAAILTKKPLDLAAGLELIVKDVPPQAKPLGFWDTVKILSFGHMGVVNPMEQLQMGPYAPAEGAVLRGLMLEMEKLRPGFIQELFYSHPPVDVRIEDLKEMDKILNPPGGPAPGGLARRPPDPNSGPSQSGSRLGSDAVSTNAASDASLDVLNAKEKKAFRTLIWGDGLKHLLEDLNHVGLPGITDSMTGFALIRSAQEWFQAPEALAVGPLAERTSTYKIVFWSLASTLALMLLIAKVGFTPAAAGGAALLMLGGAYVAISVSDMTLSNGIATGLWRLARKDPTLYQKFMVKEAQVEAGVGTVGMVFWAWVMGLIHSYLGDKSGSIAWTYLLASGLIGAVLLPMLSSLKYRKLEAPRRSRSIRQDLQHFLKEIKAKIYGNLYIKRIFLLSAADFLIVNPFVYLGLYAYVKYVLFPHALVPPFLFELPVIGVVTQFLESAEGVFALLAVAGRAGSLVSIKIMDSFYKNIKSLEPDRQIRLNKWANLLSIPGLLMIGGIWIFATHPQAFWITLGIMVLSSLLRAPAEVMWKVNFYPALYNGDISDKEAERLVSKLYALRNSLDSLGTAIGMSVLGFMIGSGENPLWVISALGLVSLGHVVIALMHLIENYWTIPLLREPLLKLWKERGKGEGDGPGESPGGGKENRGQEPGSGKVTND